MWQYMEMGKGMWRWNPFCIVALLSSIELQIRKALQNHPQTMNEFYFIEICWTKRHKITTYRNLFVKIEHLYILSVWVALQTVLWCGENYYGWRMYQRIHHCTILMVPEKHQTSNMRTRAEDCCVNAMASDRTSWWRHSSSSCWRSTI